MAEFDTIRTAAGARAAQIDEGLRAHMNKVYGTMSVGMLLTFAVPGPWQQPATAGRVPRPDDPATQHPGVDRHVRPADHGVRLRRGTDRLSAAGAQLFFYVFAAVMGLSLSWIFVAFTGFSIAQVFLVTSIAFAGLSLVATPPRKTSRNGHLPDHGVIGLIVASVINIFLGSPRSCSRSRSWVC